MKKLVVGDIHGGHRALIQVIERVGPKNEDQFIFVGDYVDGWSENVETIRFLVDFSKTHDCIFLRGNHDELCYNYLKHRDAPSLWLQHGGTASKASYDAIPKQEWLQHIQFFEALKNYHIDSENRLYVHAGFTNLHGPSFEYYPNLVYWDRTLWEMALAVDPNLSLEDDLYPKRLQLFKEIYIGHTPVTRIGKSKPHNAANVWNVDTGAAFKGCISILDVDSKELWQSDPVHLLYPDEEGRN